MLILLTALSSFVCAVIAVNIAITCAIDGHTFLVAFTETAEPSMFGQTAMIHERIRI